MLETLIATRTRPLTSDASTPTLPHGLTVRVLAPAARFSLRLRQPPDLVGGFRLDQPINRSISLGDRSSARLGPDEWLIGGVEADHELIQSEIEAALRDTPHALVDVSHRDVTFEIAGAKADMALNAGCPLDLDDGAFGAGAATRTLLGKAEVVLTRPTSARLYHVACWRSFATYVHGFLVESVHGLG